MGLQLFAVRHVIKIDGISVESEEYSKEGSIVWDRIIIQITRIALAMVVMVDIQVRVAPIRHQINLVDSSTDRLGQGSFQQQTYGQQGQQYSQQTYSDATYQPPSSAQGSSPYDPTSTGMQAKTEALVSYLFGWVSGMVFLIIERKNRSGALQCGSIDYFFGDPSYY